MTGLYVIIQGFFLQCQGKCAFKSEYRYKITYVPKGILVVKLKITVKNIAYGVKYNINEEFCWEGMAMNNYVEDKYELVSPIDGKIIRLSDVPDKVFTDILSKCGAAVDSTGDVVVSPGDGELTLVFKEQHAFGITLDNGVEVIVHIGINTVELNGKGFQLLKEEGTRVKKGEPIIKFDRKAIESKGYSLIVPVIIANLDRVHDIEFACGASVKAGKDTIYTYKID